MNSELRKKAEEESLHLAQTILVQVDEGEKSSYFRAIKDALEPLIAYRLAVEEAMKDIGEEKSDADDVWNNGHDHGIAACIEILHRHLTKFKEE